MSSSDSDVGFFREKEKKNENKNNIDEIYIDLPLSDNKKCLYCNKIPIDQECLNVFNKNVCKNCKFEKLKLITKTTCRDEYLLCNEELNDFKCLYRPNPHKGSWSNMSLYLEEEIIEYAIKKHISLENINKIKNDRIDNLIARKKNNMVKKLRDLKRKTIVVDNQSKKKHVHEFYYEGNFKKCKCGLEYEEMEL